MKDVGLDLDDGLISVSNAGSSNEQGMDVGIPVTGNSPGTSSTNNDGGLLDSAEEEFECR